MRFQTKKVSAGTTALALVLGVTAVLATALPASASTITSFTPTWVSGVLPIIPTSTARVVTSSSASMKSSANVRVLGLA